MGVVVHRCCNVVMRGGQLKSPTLSSIQQLRQRVLRCERGSVTCVCVCVCVCVRVGVCALWEKGRRAWGWACPGDLMWRAH